MTNTDFTTAARAEAWVRHPDPVDVETGEPVDDWGFEEQSRRDFREGAEWARDYLAAQEPADEKMERLLREKGNEGFTQEQGDAVHFIDLVIEDSYVRHEFRCTATQDAPCRRRPPDADGRESWTAEEATETGHPCWAADWVDAVGFDDAVHGTDGTLGSVPVTVGYEEGVEVERVSPMPALPDLSAARATEYETGDQT